jgi:probable rRNA maturation factor
MPKKTAICNFFGFSKNQIPLLKKAAELTLSRQKKEFYQINFILVSDEQIKKLNIKFRHVRRITDVISFLVFDEMFIGDIYISDNRTKKQAKKYGHSWDMELAYLVIHGVLHLCGFTDYDERNKKIMFAKQDEIFQCLF